MNVQRSPAVPGPSAFVIASRPCHCKSSLTSHRSLPPLPHGLRPGPRPSPIALGFAAESPPSTGASLPSPDAHRPSLPFAGRHSPLHFRTSLRAPRFPGRVLVNLCSKRKISKQKMSKWATAPSTQRLMLSVQSPLTSPSSQPTHQIV